MSREETGKYVMGSVPVEEDGSASFEIPSGVAAFFHAIDGEGRAVQTMRSLTYVQPVLDRRCSGCHSPGGKAPACDLTGPSARGSLLAYADNDLQNLVFEKDASIPGESPSLCSKLLQYLAGDELHRKIVLGADERDRLHTWMDTYGHT